MSSALQRHKKVGRYLFFGVVTAGIEFGVFMVLAPWTHIYIASTVSFGVGLTASFLFNKFFVFKNSKQVAKTEAGQFTVLGIVNSQLSSLVTYGLSLMVPDWVAKIFTMAMIAVWNYLIMNLVIFRRR